MSLFSDGVTQSNMEESHAEKICRFVWNSVLRAVCGLRVCANAWNSANAEQSGSRAEWGAT
jgi:hypothetical protein